DPSAPANSIAASIRSGHRISIGFRAHATPMPVSTVKFDDQSVSNRRARSPASPRTLFRRPSMSVVASHSPRWTRRKEARPGELLEAALELFVERGFASTRLDEVAARAGVSKGTLYLYFASKEDLFKAVVRQNIVPLIEAFERDVAASEAASPDLLRGFFEAWWTRF